MEKSLRIISQIIKLSREAEGLLKHPEDKQVMVEIRLAADAVVSSKKWRVVNPKRIDD